MNLNQIELLIKYIIYKIYIWHFLQFVEKSGIDLQNNIYYYSRLLEVLHLFKKFQQQYHIDLDKMTPILLELNRLLPLPQKTFTKTVEKKKQKILAMHRRYRKKGILIFALCLPYISDKRSIRNLLLINKQVSLTLQEDVHRHLFLHTQISRKSRVELYRNILGTRKLVFDYYKVKEKILIERPLNKGIDDVIMMDVKRSFHGFKSIDSTALTGLLRTYAYYNPDIEYCQGMHFIAGFLYYLVNNEAEAFRLLRGLIERFKMTSLFSEDVPMLRVYFYQMDRLMSTYFPRLTAYFRNEGVISSYFASAWFITLFTNSLEYSKDRGPSEMLLAIWDAFIVHGWKAIFRAGLFFISLNEVKLMESKFEQIMILFGNLPKSEEMFDLSVANQFRKQYKTIKVTNSILSLLHDEYKSVA